MNTPSKEQIISVVNNYLPPFLSVTLKTLKASVSVETKDNSVSVDIQLPYPAKRQENRISEEIQKCLKEQCHIEISSINLRSKIKTHAVQETKKPMEKIKNIIAIASGKGGVGKSTIAVNLALALSAEGASVGLLDADIYGPSQPAMLGVAPGTRPDVAEEKYFIPIEAHGLQVMSIGFLSDERTPMVWRGPMASGALNQLLNQTIWKDLDYLVIDMPPGTGDIQLTLSQSIPVTGALIVTTPQNIALHDAQKGIEMFHKVNIPVLGVVENMSLHTCSQCGHTEHIFGEGGGEQIALDYDTELLGSLPLMQSIREQSDSGNPSVIAEPESKVAAIYFEIAQRLAANIAQRKTSSAIGNVVMVNP